MSSYKDAVPVFDKNTGIWTLSYQVTNDKGEPVGSPTVFTGASEKECFQKAMHSHQEATQMIDRLRKNQTIYKPGTTVPVSEAEAIKIREQAKNTREEGESYRFMRSHVHDFNPCMANAQILRDIMDREGLDWTQENLEFCFSKALQEGKLAPVAFKYGGDTIAEVPPAPPPPIEVPWPNPLTRAAAIKMDRDEYKQYYFSKNEPLRAEFRRQLAEAGIV
jgi:hypothetical protein